MSGDYLDTGRAARSARAGRTGGRINVSQAHPRLILVQPEGIGISSDEFINGKTIYHRRPRDALLLSMDENRHEFLAPGFAGSPFGSSQFSFSLRHGGHHRYHSLVAPLLASVGRRTNQCRRVGCCFRQWNNSSTRTRWEGLSSEKPWSSPQPLEMATGAWCWRAPNPTQDHLVTGHQQHDQTTLPTP